MFFYLEIGFDAMFANVIAFVFFHLGKDQYSKFTKIILFMILFLVPFLIMAVSIVSEAIMG